MSANAIATPYETFDLPEPLAPVYQEHQLIVLGRGMSDHGQSVGELTAERALATQNYYREYLPVRVIFSGLGTAMANGDMDVRMTEAGAMAEIADLPEDVSVIEAKSRTTIENFIECATLLDPNLPTSVLAHENHLKRALFLGRNVLNQEVIGVAAEDFGASPEAQQNPKLEKLERILRIKDRALLLGVKNGDIEAYRRRADWEHSAKEAIKPLTRPILSRLPQYQ